MTVPLIVRNPLANHTALHSQIFFKAVGSSIEAQVLVNELKGLAELDLKHAVMKKYTP